MQASSVTRVAAAILLAATSIACSGAPAATQPAASATPAAAATQPPGVAAVLAVRIVTGHARHLARAAAQHEVARLAGGDRAASGVAAAALAPFPRERIAREQDLVAARAGAVDVLGTAKSIAATSSLIGSSSGWTSPANVEVAWSGTPCPPANNQDVAYVTITLHHQVPIFFPWIPGNGNLSTSAQFRMEPKP